METLAAARPRPRAACGLRANLVGELITPSDTPPYPAFVSIATGTQPELEDMKTGQ